MIWSLTHSRGAAPLPTSHRCVALFSYCHFLCTTPLSFLNVSGDQQNPTDTAESLQRYLELAWAFAFVPAIRKTLNNGVHGRTTLLQRNNNIYMYVSSLQMSIWLFHKLSATLFFVQMRHNLCFFAQMPNSMYGGNVAFHTNTKTSLELFYGLRTLTAAEGKIANQKFYRRLSKDRSVLWSFIEIWWGKKTMTQNTNQ